MHLIIRNLLLLSGILAMAAAGPIACGDDGGDNGNGGGGAGEEVGLSFSSALSADTPLAELDENDSQTLCHDFAEGWSNANQAAADHGSCKVSGMASAGFTPSDRVGACSETYDDCMLDIAQEQEEEECPAFEGLDSADCSITVGDFFDCWLEVADGLSTIGTQFQCSDLPEVMNDQGHITDDALNAASENAFMSGPACTYVGENCSTLYAHE